MTNAVKRDWVNCPICGESDMRREEDAEGNALILCVNHACASNGGTNADALEKAKRETRDEVAWLLACERARGWKGCQEHLTDQKPHLSAEQWADCNWQSFVDAANRVRSVC